MTANMSPAEQVDALAAEALQHRAVRHPYLAALANGAFPDTRAALADFARHYHGYSTHFPRYLATLVGRLESPAHRRALLDNLTEESGQYPEHDLVALEEIGIERGWIEGIPHPQLFERFCRAVGVDPRQWVLTGGEDHAIVATFPPDVKLPARWKVIGEVVDWVSAHTSD